MTLHFQTPELRGINVCCLSPPFHGILLQPAEMIKTEGFPEETGLQLNGQVENNMRKLNGWKPRWGEEKEATPQMERQGEKNENVRKASKGQPHNTGGKKTSCSTLSKTHRQFQFFPTNPDSQKRKPSLPGSTRQLSDRVRTC